MLLLAHIDVVSASSEDWSNEPFKLLEKDGYLYGRGVWDNKFMAAAFVANLIRYKQEGLRPARDIILALETDEEILDANEMGIRRLRGRLKPTLLWHDRRRCSRMPCGYLVRPAVRRERIEGAVS